MSLQSSNNKGKNTIADELSSPPFNKQISLLVEEVLKKNSAIEGPRPPDPELQKAFSQHLEQVNELRGRPLYYPYIGSGIGRGAYVELEDGSVKLDLINGIGVNILGHSHPTVLEASLKGALGDVVMQGNLQPGREYAALAEKLVALAKRKSRLRHVWLSTCGTIANENALKIVRQKKSPARMILTYKDAFAGRSTLMAEITDNPAYKQGLPEYHEVLRIPFCNITDANVCKTKCYKDKALGMLKEYVAQHKNNICCFVFEPMLGEGGYRVPCSDFYKPVLGFLKEQGIPIWADEVQTFTRTGEFFAYETMGIGDFVDVVTIAKTAQNGATLFTDEFNPQPGLIAGTFSGSSAGLAAGRAILDLLDDGSYMGPQGKVQKIHKQFVGMLNHLNEGSCKGLLRDAGGLGLMVAVTPLDGSKEKVTALLKALFKNGLMAFNCGHGPVRLRFLLPAVLTEHDIAVAEKIIEKSVLEMA